LPIVTGRTFIKVIERGHDFFKLILMKSANFICLSRRTESIAIGSDHKKTQYCGRFDSSVGSLFVEAVVIIIICTRYIGEYRKLHRNIAIKAP
jgi:hypothetical protein